MFSASSTSSGKTEIALKKMLDNQIFAMLSGYGAQGVALLSAFTPVDSGETARSWYYEITRGAGGYSLVFRNSHVVDGAAIAILLQYGHGTGTGGYVQGRDYINPAIQPLFDKIAADAWKVVTSA